MSTVPVLKSRRFWTAVSTVVINVATFVAATYLPSPDTKQLATIVIGGVTTVGAILIASYTVEDSSINAANAAIAQAQVPSSVMTGK